jgi:hypothetical protein
MNNIEKYWLRDLVRNDAKTLKHIIHNFEWYNRKRIELSNVFAALELYKRGENFDQLEFDALNKYAVGSGHKDWNSYLINFYKEYNIDSFQNYYEIIKAPSNESGQGKNTPITQELKPLLLKWNWGAFFLPFIWVLSYNFYLPLIIILGLVITNVIFLFIDSSISSFIFYALCIVELIISILLGVKGNMIAWKNKKWESTEAFIFSQKRWRNWGVIILIIGVFIQIIQYVSLS